MQRGEKRWSQKEVDFLKKNYGKILVKEIQKRFLPNRSIIAIGHKAFILKIKSNFSFFKKGEENIAKRPEIRRKIGNALKGIPKSEKHKQKLRIIKKGKTYEQIYGKKVAEKIKQDRIKILKKRWKETDFPQKLAKIMRKKWQDPEYKENTIKAQKKGMKIRPTKPEKFVIKIKRKHKLPYIYNGGRIGEIICGKKPDFVDFENKKIIEVFSDWHKRGLISNSYHSSDYYFPLLRKRLFAREGYQTLIIWEKDIKKNPIQIENKIVEFMKNSGIIS